MSWDNLEMAARYRSELAYVVGEKGPEFFVPGSAGTIVPNVRQPNAVAMAGSVGSGGVTIIINGDVSGEEIITKVREGLLRVGHYNPDIFGGRA